MEGSGSERSSRAAQARAALDKLAVAAGGDPRKLASLARMALANGAADRAYAFARQALALAPDDPEIRSLTHRPLSAQVPDWHFSIVRDEARNEAWEAALRRAVGPQSRVLDIGSGTGLLAMMAARAGAASVVSCEANVAVAAAAAEIVARNGLADRIRVVPKHSTDLDSETDLGGPVDLIVSEIISSDVLNQSALPVMADARTRLLKPVGGMIPASAVARVALAYWEGLSRKRMGFVRGFDMTPFNSLEKAPYPVPPGDAGLILRSEPADLFEFDFTTGATPSSRRCCLALAATDSPVNGVVQWIRLQVDARQVYENRPGAGANSCWSCLFHPFTEEIRVAAGSPVEFCTAHDLTSLRIWREI